MMIDGKLKDILTINDLEKMKLRYQEIQKACREEWGVAITYTYPLTQYDSYISKIYEMIFLIESKNEIFYYLWCLEEEFGIQSNVEKIESFIEKLFRVFSDPSLNIIKLKVTDIKEVFCDIIHEKMTFEEASAWASKMMQLEESEQIECDEKDIGKIFDGLTYLIGMDLIDEKGSYFYSISTLKKEFDDLFINNFTTHERIENAFIEDWNPLCLKNDEDKRKKYYSYASTVYKLLLFHKSEKEIFDYLWSVETEKMGLKGNKEKTKEFVKKLIDLSHDYFN